MPNILSFIQLSLTRRKKTGIQKKNLDKIMAEISPYLVKRELTYSRIPINSKEDDCKENDT